MENDDTLKNIIDELNDQHDQDVKKLSQVLFNVSQSLLICNTNQSGERNYF